MIARHAVLLTLGLAFSNSSGAAAQTTPPAPTGGAGTWFFGISTGAGHRSVTGTGPTTPEGPSTNHLPSGATGEVDLEGGIGLSRRVSALALYERSITFGDSQGWSTFAIHGVIRAWVSERFWVEGGAGASELAQDVPATIMNAVTHSWTPSFEAGAGYGILRWPHAVLQLLGRYSVAQFDAMLVQTLSIQIGLLGRS